MEIQVLKGTQINSVITELAHLRLKVFREYPYLYDGDEAYENRYLANYAQHPEAICVVAKTDQGVVGASTAMPLSAADRAFQTCFAAAEWNLNQVYYFGESVVLPEHRGRGLGKQFFYLREQQAQSLGARWCAFCAVDRPPNHPKKPYDYRDLGNFWQKLGFTRQAHLQAHFTWRDLDQPTETSHSLTFWLKPIDTCP